MAITRVERDEIFLLFALTECGRALDQLRELRDLCSVREQISHGLERRELRSVFDRIRLMLHFAGSVSRIFWSPGRGEIAHTRSERLRQRIGLPDDHALKNRALRDHVEHIDERLDRWTAESPRPFTTIEMVLYDDSHEKTRDQALASVAVVYDQASDQVILFGEVFDLNELEIALKDVRTLISEGLSARYRNDSWAL